MTAILNAVTNEKLINMQKEITNTKLAFFIQYTVFVCLNYKFSLFGEFFFTELDNTFQGQMSMLLSFLNILAP